MVSGEQDIKEDQWEDMPQMFSTIKYHQRKPKGIK